MKVRRYVGTRERVYLYADVQAPGDSVADFRAALLETHAKLKAARSIAIVGAGAVGVELAGEIVAGMPGKRTNQSS